MLKLKNIFKLALAATVLCGFSGLAMADHHESKKDSGKKMMSTKKSSADVEVSDEQIGQFVKAQKKVRKIVKKNRDVLMKKKKTEKRSQVQSKMASAIEDSGLKVETYNKIAQAVQKDQGLRKRFMEKMSESQN